MPTLAPVLAAQLSRLAAQYISYQRNRYRPAALPIPDPQKTELAGFFASEVLDEARLLVLTGERVANPAFYPMLRRIGFKNLPDQSVVAAITFVDTVVGHVPFTNELLFHELVHVEQYRQLGIERFAELYVRGFLEGGGYDGIPLEQNAYLLGEEYARQPGKAFSVAAVVARWISEQRF